MLSYEFYKISKNSFFTEHLWATASVDAPGKGGDLKCSHSSYKYLRKI